MKPRRVGAFVAVLASGIAGCDHGSSPPKGDPIPREAYVDTSVREICAALETCCSSRGFRFNAEACDANVREFKFDKATEFCPAPALHDAQAGGNCLAERKAALSSCAPDPVWTSGSCQHQCTGTVAAGQACTRPSDCAPGEMGWGWCYPFNQPGKCVQPVRGKKGDSCTTGFIQSPFGISGVLSAGGEAGVDWGTCISGDGLYCASVSSAHASCQPFLGIGKDCTQSVHTLRRKQAVDGVTGNDDALCAPELYCNESKVCVARKGKGEACTDDDQCLSFVCGSTTGRCLPTGAQDITAEFCADPM